MNAYENSLMLTRVYPFTTHDNHIQSQCTPLCDEETNQEYDMREPPGAVEEGEAVSSAGAPVPTGEGEGCSEAEIRPPHVHGGEPLQDGVQHAVRRVDVHGNRSDPLPVRRAAPVGTDRRVGDRVLRAGGDCVRDTAVLGAAPDGQPLRPFLRLQLGGGRSASSWQTTRRFGSIHRTGQRSKRMNSHFTRRIISIELPLRAM